MGGKEREGEGRGVEHGSYTGVQVVDSKVIDKWTVKVEEVALSFIDGS